MRMTIALLGALIVAGTASAQTVTNGSFETGNFDTTFHNPYQGPGYQNDLGNGSSAIDGWTVVRTDGGNVSWLKNGNNYGISSSNGSFSLDLSGSSDNGSYGDMQQTLSTIAGHTYSLSFDVGTNYYGNTSANYGAVSAFIDGIFLVNVGNPNIVGPAMPQTWLTGTTQFVAAGSSTLLDLKGTSGGQYAGLDNVVVTDLGSAGAVDALPEPAAWAMIIVGVGAIGGTMRRRRQDRFTFARAG